MATTEEPRAKIMRFLFGIQNYISCVTFLIKKKGALAIAPDLGQFVETLHVIPPSFQDVYISILPTVCKSRGQYHMQSICQTNSGILLELSPKVIFNPERDEWE